MTVGRPSDRLTTTDASGKRVYVYPSDAKGRYQSRKGWVHAALLLFFVVLPWIHWEGKQVVLLDVTRREFFLFGLHFRAHDAPLLLLLLLSFTFAIGFVTAVWGRFWCGWTCPQTVFGRLFFRIERLIEGNHRDRKKLDESPWDGRKLVKKSLKWGAFLVLSLAITHSFLGYFVGTRELVGMTLSSPGKNWGSFLVMLVSTGIVLFDFGWFREQFCTIMCPYGRFQSVLLDADSLVVAYDEKRGEPRRGLAPKGETGDCVDCLKCVQVCPTGIDIRHGLQMECIACAACIDACDGVMAKTKKPLGLIRYTTQGQLSGKKSSDLHPRTMVYASLFLVVTLTLGILLARKNFLETTILRANDTPYQLISGELVANHFRVDVSNQTGQPVDLIVALSPEAKALGVELVMPLNPIHLEDSADARADFFLRFPTEILESGSKKVSILFHHGDHIELQEVTLVGPGA